MSLHLLLILAAYVWLRRKLLPTTAPVTVPMIAPAKKSENQWMFLGRLANPG